MAKRIVLSLGAAFVALIAVGGTLYVWNSTPRVARISSTDAADLTKPYVVKLHAQWCPICMLTRGVWSQVERSYSGSVNLVVFDFTNQKTTDASRAEATRLGLQTFFDENAGWTGVISVLDGRTKEEVASLHGIHKFSEYRDVIDRARVMTHNHMEHP